MKTFVLSGLSLGLFGSALGAMPVAVWTDFTDLTRGEYRWEKSAGTTVTDGVVTIGSDGGLRLTFASGQIHANRTVTLVLDAEVPVSADERVLVDVMQNTYSISLTCKDNTLFHRWNLGSEDRGSATWEPTRRQTIAVTYKGASGSDDRGIATYVDGVQKMYNQGLMTAGGNITSLCIGTGASAGAKAATGMKIYRALLFDTNLSPNEMREYCPLPDYARFGNFDIYTWKAVGENISFSSATMPKFNRADWTDSSESANWKQFAEGQSGYAAPGVVLRFVGGYCKNADASFTPLSLGGLIVEGGANDGYVMTDRKDSGSDRATRLGDTRTSGGIPTWFVCKENFSFNRHGPTTLFGEINFDVASGRLLDLNSQRAEQTLALDVGTSAKLRMRGEGGIKVARLTATGPVTLDYSDLDARVSTEPYIAGELAIDEATVIRLPATVTSGQAYRMATTISGPVSGQSQIRTIYLGETAVERAVTFDTANGTILYQSDPVARIGTKFYSTLGEALSNVRTGETVLLLSNIVVQAALTTSEEVFTLDIAGHDLVLQASVQVNGAMTVTDSAPVAGHIDLGSYLTGDCRLAAGKTKDETAATANDFAYVPLLQEEGDYRYQVKPAQASECLVVPVTSCDNRKVAEAVVPKSWILMMTGGGLSTADDRALAVAVLNRPRPVGTEATNNGFSLIACYILGLSTERADSVPFVTTRQNDRSDTISLLLGNVSVRRETDVSVKFVLFEEATPCGVRTAVETKADTPSFEVAVPPAESPLRYYTIGYAIGG